MILLVLVATVGSTGKDEKCFLCVYDNEKVKNWEGKTASGLCHKIVSFLSAIWLPYNKLWIILSGQSYMILFYCFINF